jgi:exodeoxyribonuclease VII small subunit
MSDQHPQKQLDELLAELEKSIAKLADGSAPLDELVAAHQRALGLLDQARSRLADLKARADEAAETLAS